MRKILAAAAVLCGAGLVGPAWSAAEAAAARLQPCKLTGVETAALCGSIERPLDPAKADGKTIQVHYAVLPALARNKKPDPVFFFAGGPGQSAIDIAATVERLLARLSNRRDIVLVDQRGTGRSAPLACWADSPTRPLAEQVDLQRQTDQLIACLRTLQAQPHGDLRRYTTTIAMQDVDAVRRALGAPRVNLVGGSYGTRAALEYLRQFPQTVRRIVLDGVAPPDMVLPASFSPDNQAAWDALLAHCEADAACRRNHPQLRQQWQSLLASLPREVTLPHPLTGRDNRLLLTRDTVLGMVRQPLYAPALAAGLPAAIAQAADGRFTALMGLAISLGSSRSSARLAQGMHLSVVCAEDFPRLAAHGEAPGHDFGGGFAAFYRRLCPLWPRGEVPAEFYRIAPAAVATLVLSGGLDPVTPPRHGERATRALGERARHVVVAHAGHGVMALGCMRDVLYRFIDADDDAAAMQVDASCADRLPRPPAFVPPGSEGAS